MSAELARRLNQCGAAPAQVEAALFAMQSRGVSFSEAVNELCPIAGFSQPTEATRRADVLACKKA